MATLARVCMRNPLLMRSSPMLFNMPRSIGSMQASSPPSFSCSYSSSAVEASANENSQLPKEQASTSLVDGPSRDRGGVLWRNPLNLLPFHFRNKAPISGLGSLGNALVQVSHNLNKLLEKWSPSRLLGRVKENDDCYKLRFEVPGLSKKDLKITVEDGFLVVTGERNEEEKSYEDSGECSWWYSEGYGFYNTSLLLPDDAKVEGIKAQVKDGVLYVTIPRSQEKKKTVREVEIN